MSAMLQDIRALHAEVVAFRARLKGLEDVQVQNISVIARRIEKETALLETAHADSHEPARRSTNTPDLVRMWRLARSLPALWAFNTTFGAFSRRKADAVMVDIVYRKGHAWMVRNSVKYRALLTEITNLPIHVAARTGGGDDCGDGVGMDVDMEGTNGRPGTNEPPLGFDRQESFMSLESDTTEDEELFSEANIGRLKVVEGARKVLEVAGNNLKLGAVPHVSIYFPRILEECRTEEDRDNVLRIFEVLDHMGITPLTECGPALPFELNVGLQLKDDFGNGELDLLPGRPVNLDLTTLFVLCSDISNVPLSELTKTHKALAFQMQEESTVPCLRDRVFPIVRGDRSLVCSPVARHRFLEIVGELGSAYEKQRAALFFSNAPPQETIAQLNGISIHTWPADLRLPITVHKFDMATHQPTVPFTTEYKTLIAQDCFENCWYGRMLTLSANQQAVKTFREALFSWPDEVEPRPSVYLHAARSLMNYDRIALKEAAAAQ